MDMVEDSEIIKKCYTIKENLLASLKLCYNESNSTFTFWNKYQILIYENHNFENAAKIFIPDFHIRWLINSNNYLTCLDEAGNIHVNSMKFKNSAQKRFKSAFQPRDQNVFALSKFNEDIILTLKMEAEKTIITYHQNGSDFKVLKKINLSLNESWPVSKTKDAIFICKPICSEDFETLKGSFKTKEAVGGEHGIVIISIDKLTVYGVLCSPKMVPEDIELVKLFTSPSEICDIKLSQTNEALVGLTIGTLVKLHLKSISSTPQVIHLTTAMSKFLYFSANDSLIFTDGRSLCKSVKTLSRKEIEFRQFFLKHPYDFVKVGDNLVCSTYTGQIYHFTIEDSSAYLPSISTEEYCSAENLLNNSEYFYKIHKELERNNELSVKMLREESYITALGLSRRQDIMKDVIHDTVTVYENYVHCINENTDLTLTEETQNYFKRELFFVVIKIAVIDIHLVVNEILSNIFGDLKVHVTFSTGHKQLKTVSLKIDDILKKINLLIPLSWADVMESFKVNVEIRMVTNIPGSYDESKSIWTVIYRDIIELNSEHFISSHKGNCKIVNLKSLEKSVNELVLESATKLHGNLFKFSTNLLLKKQCVLYLNLPNETDYRKAMANVEFYKNKYNSKTAEFLQKHLTSEDFLKCKSAIVFEVCGQKVKINIENNFACPQIKIVSNNEDLAKNIVRFFKSQIPTHETNELLLINDL